MQSCTTLGQSLRVTEVQLNLNISSTVLTQISSQFEQFAASLKFAAFLTYTCITLDNSNRFSSPMGVRNIDIDLYNVAHILQNEGRTIILCISCALGKKGVQ